jgi:hypothetical protein
LGVAEMELDKFLDVMRVFGINLERVDNYVYKFNGEYFKLDVYYDSYNPESVVDVQKVKPKTKEVIVYE